MCVDSDPDRSALIIEEDNMVESSAKRLGWGIILGGYAVSMVFVSGVAAVFIIFGLR